MQSVDPVNGIYVVHYRRYSGCERKNHRVGISFGDLQVAGAVVNGKDNAWNGSDKI